MEEAGSLEVGAGSLTKGKQPVVVRGRGEVRSGAGSTKAVGMDGGRLTDGVNSSCS